MGEPKKSRPVPPRVREGGAPDEAGPRKKNLRLHQSKIDEAREILDDRDGAGPGRLSEGAGGRRARHA
jgi:hypothetical protein